MLDKIREYIKFNNLINDGDKVLVGVSGGADSMCLLSVLLDFSIDVCVVHINHMLRGKDAEEDQLYVENFCRDKGIKCYSFSYDVDKIAKEKKISCEEAGRMVRYEAFNNVLKEEGCQKIAVAHNADDNAETILHNLFRGTGLKGLVGIAPKRDVIIRPLLETTRAEIESYLKTKNIEFRSDATNFEDIYTRNKIRNAVLTYAKENINVNVSGHITNTGKMLGEIDDFIEIEGNKAYCTTVSETDNGILILDEGFEELHIVIKRYIVRTVLSKVSGSLKDITHRHIEDVLGLFNNQVSKNVNLPYDMVARRTYDGVVVEKIIVNNVSNATYDEIKVCRFGEFLLGPNGKKLVVSPFSKEEWETKENKYEEKMYTKWLDCDILERNLVIRTRRPKDYIVVDGNGSKKKLKDYFIDLKIPKNDRDSVLLLADGEEILWVIGYRINYNYKITKETKNIVEFRYIE